MFRDLLFFFFLFLPFFFSFTRRIVRKVYSLDLWSYFFFGQNSMRMNSKRFEQKMCACVSQKHYTFDWTSETNHLGNDFLSFSSYFFFIVVYFYCHVVVHCLNHGEFVNFLPNYFQQSSDNRWNIKFVPSDI